jgi:hypothetical protein
VKASKVRKLIARKAHRLQTLTETPKVLIATPLQDTALAVYCLSLVHCVAQSISDGLIIGYQTAQYSMLPLSRQLLCQVAIEAGWTHILMIDSDMEFPRDLAVRMVRHHLPVVAINCMARRHPYYVTARDANNLEVPTNADSTGIQKVSRVGTGIMMIHLDVLRDIALPWWEYQWVPERGIFRGEDYVFCEKVIAAGHEIYIDHDLSKQVNHVGTFQFSPLMRKGFLEVQKAQEAPSAPNEGVAQHG